LQCQCGLTDTGFAAQKDKATWYESATENTIEFGRLHIDAHLLVCLNLLNALWFVATCDNTFFGCEISSYFLLVGTPLSAYRTAA
jgi:hypothetical protein